MNYVGEKKAELVTVDVFPDASETSFTYYDDDGATYGYEKGQYFKQRLSTQAKDGQSSFTAASVEGTFVPDVNNYLVKLHGQAGQSVTANETALSEAKNLDALLSQSGEGWSRGKDQYGEVTYVKIKAGLQSNVIVK
jgi:alpha-glucosidase